LETNGLSDLVALTDSSFLVVERSGSEKGVVVRIYRADIDSATDVLQSPSLVVPPVLPMFKSLVTDLTTTPGLTPLDNIEGITLGPRLRDGRYSVVLVSDDNFLLTQVTPSQWRRAVMIQARELNQTPSSLRCGVSASRRRPTARAAAAGSSRFSASLVQVKPRTQSRATATSGP